MKKVFLLVLTLFLCSCLSGFNIDSINGEKVSSPVKIEFRNNSNQDIVVSVFKNVLNEGRYDDLSILKNESKTIEIDLTRFNTESLYDLNSLLFEIRPAPDDYSLGAYTVKEDGFYFTKIAKSVELTSSTDSSINVKVNY